MNAGRVPRRAGCRVWRRGRVHIDRPRAAAFNPNRGRCRDPDPARAPSAPSGTVNIVNVTAGPGGGPRLPPGGRLVVERLAEGGGRPRRQRVTTRWIPRCAGGRRVRASRLAGRRLQRRCPEPRRTGTRAARGPRTPDDLTHFRCAWRDGAPTSNVLISRGAHGLDNSGRHASARRDESHLRQRTRRFSFVGARRAPFRRHRSCVPRSEPPRWRGVGGAGVERVGGRLHCARMFLVLRWPRAGKPREGAERSWTGCGTRRSSEPPPPPPPRPIHLSITATAAWWYLTPDALPRAAPARQDRKRRRPMHRAVAPRPFRMPRRQSRGADRRSPPRTRTACLGSVRARAPHLIQPRQRLPTIADIAWGQRTRGRNSLPPHGRLKGCIPAGERRRASADGSPI